MVMLAKVGKWVSRGRWRLYTLIMMLMVLPIAFFAYSVGQFLRDRTEAEAVNESTQIAQISATLVEEHFRHSTAFLESIATRPSFLDAWKNRNFRQLETNLAEANRLRPDLLFVSVYDLDGTLRAIYPRQTDLLNRNFAYRDW